MSAEGGVLSIILILSTWSYFSRKLKYKEIKEFVKGHHQISGVTKD